MESKKIELDGRKYVLNKIPAFQAQKISFYCLSALKTKNLSEIPDDVIIKICSYIGAENANGVEIRLTDEDLININVKDSGILMQLEMRLLEYNFDFFFDGSLLREIAKILGRLNPKAEEGETDSSKA